MSERSERAFSLAEKRRKLLALRLKSGEESNKDVQHTIKRREQNSDHELVSFAQERIWFLEQLQPSTSFYNLPQAFRLSGQINARALEQSFNEIVRRHEVLRTTFSMRGASPVQIVNPPSAFLLPCIDLRSLPTEPREAEARRCINLESQRPFDVRRDAPIRFSLLRLGEREHILLVTMHHIASDGWSLAILNHELGVLYAAFSRGEPSPLAELPIQYADFAVWQRA